MTATELATRAIHVLQLFKHMTVHVAERTCVLQLLQFTKKEECVQAVSVQHCVSVIRSFMAMITQSREVGRWVASEFIYICKLAKEYSLDACHSEIKAALE